MSDTSDVKNGSVNNAVLLKTMLEGFDSLRAEVRATAADLRTEREVALAKATQACVSHRAGVDSKVSRLGERLDRIEQDVLPPLTSTRSKLIFIPTAISFVLGTVYVLYRLGEFVINWVRGG